jgi:hypothetical protein
MLFIFFDIKGIVQKEMCKGFAPNFGNKRTRCCIMIMHHLTLPFSPGNFLANANPHPTYFFLFSQLKIKLRVCHFETIWGDQGRITGGAQHSHRTQLPGCILKNARSVGNSAYTRKNTTLSMIMASRPKASFNQMAVPVLETVDGFLYMQ